MQARIDSLERQLEQANERDRENRRIIAALTTRIAEIEAPETPDTHPQGAQPRSGTGSPMEAREQPFTQEEPESKRSLNRKRSLGPGCPGGGGCSEDEFPRKPKLRRWLNNHNLNSSRIHRPMLST
jgi:hypothetical protein